jgi:hypothetical protein
LAVQQLNQTLCFVSSSVLADRFELGNRQLLAAANRWQSFPQDCRPEAENPRRKKGKTKGINTKNNLVIF